MDFHYLDKNEYSDIMLMKMSDNLHGDLPFFIRRYTEKASQAPLHRHEFMQINYIYQGRGKHFLRNHEFDIIKGDIFVIPPFIPHFITIPEGSHIEIFEFEFLPEFISENFQRIENAEAFLDFAYIEPFLMSENKIRPRLNITGKIQVEVESILNEALQEFTERPTGFELLVKALLLKLLIIVGREFKSEAENSNSGAVYVKHKDSIYGAIKYFTEHYHEEIVIEDVARKFALSQSYFSYLFKSLTSKTFTEYINSLRISKAMELLKITDRRILDICCEVGFNNVNHFNRIFRQQTGLSPREFRKTEIKGTDAG